jgi:hypothetical protein
LWWQELDYSYFMWAGVGLGILLLIQFCRRLFKETAEFVAPVSNEEFDALAGRFLPCARCDNRLAVNIFVLPDGEEEPLCHSCFQRKSRDYNLAMSLLDGKKISARLGIDVGPSLPAASDRATGGEYLEKEGDEDEGDAPAPARAAQGDRSRSSSRSSSTRSTDGGASGNSRSKLKRAHHDQGRDRSDGGRVNSTGQGKVKGTGAKSYRSSTALSGVGSGDNGSRTRRHRQREAWTPPSPNV